MLWKVSMPEDRTSARVVSLHELTRRNFTDPHLSSNQRLTQSALTTVSSQPPTRCLLGPGEPRLSHLHHLRHRGHPAADVSGGGLFTTHVRRQGGRPVSRVVVAPLIEGSYRWMRLLWKAAKEWHTEELSSRRSFRFVS